MTMDEFAERQEVKLVKAHAINSDGSYRYQHHASTRPIDGSLPAIQISQIERLGYVTIPTKPGEHYESR